MPGSTLPDLTREDFLAMLRSPDTPANVALEWKISPTGILDADDDGIITAIVAVTGIVDEVDDIILPGAFTETLARRTPKGVWSHDVHTWVSRTDAIGELMPGDLRLPKQWKGRPWPAEAGALVVRTAFNLGTQAGADACSNVKFFDAGPLGPQVEWSIGYNSIPGYAKRNRLGQRELSKIDLYEYGPVLFGAMPLAGTVGTKARIDALEHKGGFRVAGNGTIIGDLELKVAGKEASPKDVKNTDKLKRYWEHGEGAAKIRWGEPGDFNRCVRELSKYLPPNQVKGYCANRHKGATGGWPGHAPGVEQAEADAKKAAKGKKDGDLDSIEAAGAALLDQLEGKSATATDEDARAAFEALGMTDDEIEAALADDPEWTSLPGAAVEIGDPGFDGDDAGAGDGDGAGAADDGASGDGDGAPGDDGTEYKAARAAGDLEVGDVILEMKGIIGGGQVKATSTRAGLVGIAIQTKDGLKTTWVPDDTTAQVRVDPFREIKDGLRLVIERKDYPYLPGSVEERQQEIREAVNDLLLPEPDEKGNRNAYVSLDATFADYVVATLNDYSIGIGSDGEQAFAIPYTFTADGDVDLGQPVPVEKQVVLTPAGDVDDTPPAPATPAGTPPGGMNPAVTIARKIATQAKALLDDLEAKAAAGVDLSGTHVRRIRAADEALDGALAGLGHDRIDVTPIEGKALLGEVASLFTRAADI